MTRPDTPELNRRRVLASAGLVGAGAFGGAVGVADRVTRDPREYTHYTYARVPAQVDGTDTADPRLRVAWESRYNGERVATSGEGPEFVDDAAGPLFSASNVLPGDYGTASIRLAVEGDEPVQVRVVPVVRGSLATAVSVRLGYDTGVFGIGACDGADRPDDVAGDVTMSLAAFGEAYGDEGLSLNPDCLAPDEELCLGFGWKFPATETNEWQRASTTFELAFHAEGCSE
ncbi:MULTISPECIES: hypothetical protein [Halolamina]|uniref:SipW-cognate class signal peptide n=1 Tax=Halolamina pelagica TaxID=699431 RepID=A0A1I5Q9H1_9EURY|nr:MULTISPECIES: hypothetical protein [Halolamina]NHX35165.1 hypothetical protein [Halolamina sp. R1-12]SFP42968.1 hypothetical protein SAMN05216277_103324 [Halolamina pelagica]